MKNLGRILLVVAAIGVAFWLGHLDAAKRHAEGSKVSAAAK